MMILCKSLDSSLPCCEIVHELAKKAIKILLESLALISYFLWLCLSCGQRPSGSPGAMAA